MADELDKKRVVWVLGSGFSQPLGGPQLPDLLSLKSRGDLQARYPDCEGLHSTGAAKAVYALYHFGRAYPEGMLGLVRADRGIKGERYWVDAEDFLDYIDTAKNGGPLAERLSRMSEFATPDGSAAGMPNWTALADAGRRIIAAECSAFASDADLESEKWQAHVRWARLLDATDTIVTFNYDTVLERLADARGVQRLGVRSVVMSSNDLALGRDQAKILKLHGSVDWKLGAPASDGSPTVEQADREFALKCSPGELAIATPGPTKRQNTGGPFRRLWSEAKDALKKAEAVVFVGYRFPPSDAQAREELLGAIAANESTDMVLHIVLGPRTSGDDVVRLTRLLQYAAANGHRVDWLSRVSMEQKTHSVVVHPMYSQDFLSLYDRRLLWNNNIRAKSAGA